MINVHMRADFDDIVKTKNFFKYIWGLLYPKNKEQWRGIFREESSSQMMEWMLNLAGFGMIPEKGEHEKITYDKVQIAYKKGWTMKWYALGYVISKLMAKHDQYGIMKQLYQNMVRAAYNTKELIHADIFNRGTTVHKTIDDLPIFSASHPIKRGGVQSNMFDTPRDLTETSLQDAILAMESYVDHAGIPLNKKAKTLIVEKGIRFKAKVLLNTEKKVGSADNDENSIYDEDIKMIRWNYLTEPGSWYLKSDDTGEDDKVLSFVGQGFEHDYDNDFETKGKKHSLDFMFMALVGDPLCLFKGA